MSEQYPEYEQYLKEHCLNVRKAFYWIRKSCPDILKNADKVDYEWNILLHDDTRTVNDEYYAYYDYFYNRDKKGKCKNKYAEQNFRIAKLAHYHRNPDHWQHWILLNDDEGEEYLEIPLCYIIEMICDWWSFSWKTGNLMEIFNYYDQHKDKIKMNEFSRNKLEDILKQMREKLEASNLNE